MLLKKSVGAKYSCAYVRSRHIDAWVCPLPPVTARPWLCPLVLLGPQSLCPLLSCLLLCCLWVWQRLRRPTSQPPFHASSPSPAPRLPLTLPVRWLDPSACLKMGQLDLLRQTHPRTQLRRPWVAQPWWCPWGRQLCGVERTSLSHCHPGCLPSAQRPVPPHVRPWELSAF